MVNTRTKYLGLGASGLCAALLISCASEGNDDGAETQNVGQLAPTSTASMSELQNTDALLRAAQGSAGAARTGARGCFDSLDACSGDGGTMSQACIDQLKGCLPKAPPAPIGCSDIPEPTPDQIAAADDLVGQADDLVGQVGDLIGDVQTAVDDVINELLDGGIALPTRPDGGFPFPTGAGGGGRGPGGHNKGTGGRGGFGDGGVPQFPGFPPIDGDASIGGGEICGVPLPTVPVGALASCAETAAKDLQAGADPIEVATAALECIEAPFADDIAALCTDATALCGQADAPPNICGHVKEACAALTSP
jgi:hypothetical protein